MQWVQNEVIARHLEKAIAKQFKFMLQTNEAEPCWYVVQV
jgi:hypothetical protein